MAAFEYRASDRSGSMQQGVEPAADLQSAARALRARGLTPIVLKPASSAAFAALEGGSKGFSILGFGAKANRVTPERVLRFTSELGTLLQAGLPLDRAMKVQIDTAPFGAHRAMMEDILATLKSGRSLTVGLENHDSIFSGFYISMVRSGEASGKLAGVLTELASYLERSRAVRSTITSAMLYPAILAVVATLSVAIMLGYVVPEFESLFEEMGDGLPMLTAIIISLGDLVAGWWWLMAILIGGLVTAVRRWLATQGGRTWIEARALTVPLAGPLIRKFEVSRFARTMGTLLGNGVAILKAADIASGTVGNTVLRQHLNDLAPAIKRGERLSKAMQPEMFSPLAVQMVMVGEESGKLDAMLLELAQVYESEVEADVKRALTLLEPALILGMGGLIAIIIMGILMGILSVNTMTF
jgi:general secretion pathway protein F